MYSEEEYLPISGIQHFAYCRRQWALIHIENQWVDNHHTADGQVFHKNAHESQIEKRGKLLITRGLKVSSSSLGLTGICDVVEFHENTKEGISLYNYKGLWLPYPVEYKKGTSKSHQCNIMQLCAQAMCLEEMLLCSIGEGCIYYGESKDRIIVKFSDDLRKRVTSMIKEMHQYMGKGHTPVVKKSGKCEQCSLYICMPYIVKYAAVENYINNMLQENL